MSVSIQVTMSPSSTCRLFHRASPLPMWLPSSGRMSVCWKTGTPSSAAIAAVRSDEAESITTSWSISGRRSISAVRMRLMTRPIVFSSFSAGSPTLRESPCFSLSSTSRAMSRNSEAWKVFSANQRSTTVGSERLCSTYASAAARVPSAARSSSKVARPTACLVLTTITVGLALEATMSATLPNRKRPSGAAFDGWADAPITTRS